MLIEYNKFNVILYFLVGTAITFGTKRWIYGGMVILLSAVLLTQSLILHSDNPLFIKYQNVTGLLPPFMMIMLIITSLFVLMKSTIKGSQKLLSILFLVLSVGFSIYKKYFKDKPIFSHQITSYISSLLFMVVLVTITIIPDNQMILNNEYNEVKNKVSKVK